MQCVCEPSVRQRGTSVEAARGSITGCMSAVKSSGELFILQIRRPA
jgi:hypothetical protein